MTMPNWCENKITITHQDADMIANLITCIREDKDNALFQHILPMPENVFRGLLGEKERKECERKGIPNWYDWCWNNWSTKWDACHMDYAQHDDHTLEFTFDTAWSPPFGVYKALMEQGFEVEAYYLEYGAGFAGQWHCDDEYYQDDSVNIYHEPIPLEIDEVFGITEQLAEWAAEEKEYA